MKQLGSLEFNRVYQMDCLQGMKLIPNNSVKLIIADPPYYGILKEDWDNQWKDADDYLKWCDSWISECNRILDKDGSIYVYSSQQMASDIEEIVKRYFTFRKRIIWHRADNQKQRKTMYNESYEPITYATKSDNFIFNNDNLQVPSKYAGHKHKRYDKEGNPYWKEVNATKQCGDVWEISKVKGGSKEDTPHKSQKPLTICERIIGASSNPDDIIVIPFCGSGSECVTAKKMCRKFISFETKPDYIEIANQRLEAEYNEQDDEKLTR